MRAGLAAIPHLPHVAVFDTAFHATLPEDAYRYPVPGRWYGEWGVRRYGFHGMSRGLVRGARRHHARPPRRRSCAWSWRTWAAAAPSRPWTAAAPSATSMGLTPLEGLMMGTRAGSIDPGILFYLLRTGRLDADELAEQMDHDSGLVGVSGRTSDVRELLALEAAGDEAAALALAIFVRRAAEVHRRRGHLPAESGRDRLHRRHRRERGWGAGPDRRPAAALSAWRRSPPRRSARTASSALRARLRRSSASRPARTWSWPARRRVSPRPDEPPRPADRRPTGRATARSPGPRRPNSSPAAGLTTRDFLRRPETF